MARPYKLGGRSPPSSPPSFAAPQTRSSAFSPGGSSLPSPLNESRSEDRATRRLLGLLSAAPPGLSHPRRGAARTPQPGELSSAGSVLWRGCGEAN